MKRKISVTAIAVFALICLMFTACITEHPLPDFGGAGDRVWGLISADPDTDEEVIIPFTSSVPVRGRARGWSNAFVDVYITFEDGIITRLDFDLSRQTPGHVSAVPDALRLWVSRTNSFDFPVNVVTQATLSVRAIQNGAREAMRNHPEISEELVDF